MRNVVLICFVLRSLDASLNDLPAPNVEDDFPLRNTNTKTAVTNSIEISDSYNTKSAIPFSTVAYTSSIVALRSTDYKGSGIAISTGETIGLSTRKPETPIIKSPVVQTILLLRRKSRKGPATKTNRTLSTNSNRTEIPKTSLTESTGSRNPEKSTTNITNSLTNSSSLTISNLTVPAPYSNVSSTAKSIISNYTSTSKGGATRGTTTNDYPASRKRRKKHRTVGFIVLGVFLVIVVFFIYLFRI